ncbi:MAG TPA: phosphoribosyltransferase family protein [Terracidiphilus sp.]|jgi:ComF family protein|nr:phosphoribosyltransferase family protein [Terracidiphilus sp.]
MRDAIHALKYGGLRPASQQLGRFLAHAIAQLAHVAPGELLVVPVPLHGSKQTARGFNQALLLAASALSFLRKSHPGWRLELRPDILTRHRDTESQAGLTPRQRRLNLRGAFRLSDSAAVNGKHVLLIDDIFTTGATARAAAKALLNAGAESVWVATLARARMTNSRRFGFAAAYDAAKLADEEVSTGSLLDSEPGPRLQPASMYSQDQRSF